MKCFLTLVFIFFSSYVFGQNCQSTRYKERVFQNIIVQRDIQYGNADKYDGSNIDLKVDLFMPGGDTLPYRPAIIWAHAGAFIDLINDKSVNDMQAFADSFAHKGFVTMSMDYRRGYLGFQNQVERAVYRAGQDARALVRFLKANYQLYGIDTNYIFFAGSSAGGVTGLALAYVDQESERPASTYGGFGIGNDMGCLDCSTNSYTNTASIKAVVSMWGGLDDTTYMVNASEIPALLIHGTDDQIVPFDKGKPFANLGLWFPDMYGSLPLHRRMANLGMDHEFYPFDLPPATINHEFYGTTNGYWLNGQGPNQYWDTIHALITNFLYRQMKPSFDTIVGSREACIGSETVFLLPSMDWDYCIETFPSASYSILHDSLLIRWDTAGFAWFKVTAVNSLGVPSDAYRVDMLINYLPLLLLPEDTAICEGDTIELAMTSNTNNYQWTQGQSGFIATVGIGRISVAPMQNTYYEAYSLSDDGCVGKDSVLVYVDSMPTPDFSVNPNGATLSFSNSSMGANSWLWDFGDGDTSQQANPTHTYNATGSYTITLTATSNAGCSASKSLTVFVLATSLGEEKYEPLSLYPNPAENWLTVATGIGPEKVFVVDALGRTYKVDWEVAASSLIKVALPELEPAVYQLVVQTESGYIRLPFVKSQ
ncbi:MAG: PKD domain-containing protein [Chitinophagales bacterium]|nr:PKD domain-containing protein [Chitinophagales bacterium]